MADPFWLSEKETGLIVALKALAQLLVAKGVVTAAEIDAALAKDRDRFVRHKMVEAAAVVEAVIVQRQRDAESPVSPLLDLPAKGPGH